MTNVAVIGGQWGDEGKGKIVDWLSSRSDIIVRFQGGHNAGHTLVIDGVTYKLSLLPSGVVRGGKMSIIGNGVVIDPWALFAEIEAIAAKGVVITPETLRIAENAVLILPIHGIVDRAREAHNGSLTIGTTGRGIGPAYEDKIARRAIRACDLADPEEVATKVEALLHHHNALLRGLGQPEVMAEEIVPKLLDIAPRLLPYLEPVWQRLDLAHRQGSRILFEGAQGAMLDVDHGTYPFVTSSNTGAGQAATGSGLGPGAVGFVLGIVKAYTTRVGMGPFPTELQDETGERIGQIGNEFGTVTGRKKALRLVRCGDGATGGQDQWHYRHSPHQIGCFGRIPRAQNLHRLSIERAGDRLSTGAVETSTPGGADLRKPAGLEGNDPRRPKLEPIARRSDQICPAAGGADPMPSRSTLHQPAPRRCDPGARPLCALEALEHFYD